MKKITCILLLVCLCMTLAACADSGAAQAASVPAAEQSAPAADATPKPTPEPKKEPVNLQPMVDELNAVEMDQRQNKEMPFMGVYSLTEDGRNVIYKMYVEHFEIVALGADLGGEDYIAGYNETLNELPAMCQAMEDVVHIDDPDAHVYIYLMFTKDSDQILAVSSSEQILYDVLNGIGDAPTGITPILEPETTPEATPAA